MIELLPRPAICLIDDEKEDYEPMKKALLAKGIACIHVNGASVEDLPPSPISGFRVVLLDLHLSSDAGETALARTANVFLKSVAIDDSPVVVVIWSKHSDDLIGDGDATEADNIQQRLRDELGAKFEQLVFKVMPKPKREERPEESQWVGTLFNDLNTQLLGSRSIGLLWTWEGVAANSITSAITGIVDLARRASAQDPAKFKVALEAVMRELAQKQGGPDCSNDTAARHLSTTLVGLASDSLENGSIPDAMNAHGDWLCQELGDSERPLVNSSALNGILLSAAPVRAQMPFVPGMVYDVTDMTELRARLGYTFEQLTNDCFNDKGNLHKSSVQTKRDQLRQNATCVALDITPACDFHQRNSRGASLLLGLCCKNQDADKVASSKDSCKKTKVLEDRFSHGRPSVSFVFCAAYRFTWSQGELPSWMQPRMRFRDLVVTDIRNWVSSQAARVGYLSV